MADTQTNGNNGVKRITILAPNRMTGPGYQVWSNGELVGDMTLAQLNRLMATITDRQVVTRIDSNGRLQTGIAGNGNYQGEPVRVVVYARALAGYVAQAQRIQPRTFQAVTKAIESAKAAEDGAHVAEPATEVAELIG